MASSVPPSVVSARKKRYTGSPPGGERKFKSPESRAGGGGTGGGGTRREQGGHVGPPATGRKGNKRRDRHFFRRVAHGRANYARGKTQTVKGEFARTEGTDEGDQKFDCELVVEQSTPG